MIVWNVLRLDKKTKNQILSKIKLTLLFEHHDMDTAIEFAERFVHENKSVGFDTEVTVLKVYK